MAQIDLAQYGIKDVKEVIYNPSYEELFKAETEDPSLEGFEKGTVTELGAVNVMTGVYTGTVHPKTNSSYLTTTQRTKYGGLQKNIRMTTSWLPRSAGKLSKR